MEYVEVTQDGAGFLSSGSEVGIFTEKVETCSVFTFHGSEGYALVHDTGQVKLSEIAEFAKRCGAISRVSYNVNVNLISKLAKKENNDRKNKLMRIIGFKGKVDKNDLPLGNMICFESIVASSNRDFLSVGFARENLAKLPDGETRKLINILNNLFSSRNSQELPLDVQYCDNCFQRMPKLLKTKGEMQARADKELRGGDEDYINMLRIAETQGVL